MKHEEKRGFKDALYGHFARLGRALAHRRRLELLDVLAQGEHTVEELANEACMPMASASQHLQTLHRARLVTKRSEGTYAYYRLSSEAVVDLIRTLHEVGEEQLADIDKLLEMYGLKTGDVREVTADELAALMDADEVTLIDVRPHEEYKQGHISGARSVPIEELPNRLDELSGKHEVVAYCRGPYCVFAHEAVRLLTERGMRARRLRVGFPNWKRSGYRVSTAA